MASSGRCAFSLSVSCLLCDCRILAQLWGAVTCYLWRVDFNALARFPSILVAFAPFFSWFSAMRIIAPAVDVAVVVLCIQMDTSQTPW